MESPTIQGLAILNEIATEHNMHGRSEALAVAIQRDTALAIGIGLKLLRAQSTNAFVSACVQSVRELYPCVARTIDLSPPDLAFWQGLMPNPDELKGVGVLGFLYDFWPRCNAEELRAVWAKSIYGFLHAYLPNP